MKRAKEDRGKNAFERITWDEAYDIIEREMKAVIEHVRQRGHLGHPGHRPRHQRLRAAYGPVPRHAELRHGIPFGPGVLRAAHLLRPRSKRAVCSSCDYSQFFPDRYDDPRWEAPRVHPRLGQQPRCRQLRRHARPLDRGEHEARQQAHRHGPEAHLGGRQGRRVACRCAPAPMRRWRSRSATSHHRGRPAGSRSSSSCWCYGYDEFAEHVKKYTPAWAAETCGVDRGPHRGGGPQDRQREVVLPAVGRRHGPYVRGLHHRHGVLRPHGAHRQLREARAPWWPRTPYGI